MRGGHDAADIGTDEDAKSKSLGISHHIGCPYRAAIAITERSTIFQSNLYPIVFTHGTDTESN